ncbi:MAG TPA: hypothetical protein VIC35_11675 [Acidimicrobiia bacterium]
MIDRQNLASKRVIGKLGFAFWNVPADADDSRFELYRRSFSSRTATPGRSCDGDDPGSPK